MAATDASTIVTPEGVIIMEDEGKIHIVISAFVPVSLEEPSFHSDRWHGYTLQQDGSGRPATFVTGDWYLATFEARQERVQSRELEIHLVEDLG